MGKKGSGEPNIGDMKNDQPLQAVVLADSFTKTLRPITLDRPKVLLPLVNVPMLEYTLEFLAESGVDEIYVFCCWHSDQVLEYLERSKWNNSNKPIVRTISFKTTTNAGDALRELDSLGLIRSDPFILISGDVVSNMNLGPVLEAHKQRRKKSKNCVMTMVFKRLSAVHAIRPLENDLVVAVDRKTNQLLRYEDDTETGRLAFDNSELFDEHPEIGIRYDLLDCHVDICAPEVLLQIADNYDYQDLRKDFVRNEVQNHDLGYQIHMHEITSTKDYAARVHDLRTYDAISKDVINRWTYPLVPDNNWATEDSTYSHTRGFKYQESSLSLSRSCTIGDNTVIGEGSSVGDHAKLSDSVVGRRCKIGKNVTITNAYLWDDVVVGDNSCISNAVVCNNAVVGEGCTVPRGCMISFNVKVGDNVALDPFTALTTQTKSRRDHFDSFDSMGEDDAEDDGGFGTSSKGGDMLGGDEAVEQDEVVGRDGCGREWTVEEDSDYDSEEETPAWVSPAVASKIGSGLIRVTQLPGAKELEDNRAALWNEMENIESEDEDDEEEDDPDGRFIRVVRDLIHSTKLGPSTVDNVVLEINGLKFAQDRTFTDCILVTVPAVFELLVDQANGGGVQDADMLRIVKSSKELMQRFVMGPNEQLAVVEALEHLCRYGKHAARVGMCRGMPELYQGPEVIELLSSAACAGLSAKFPLMLLNYLNMEILNEDGIRLWSERRENDDDANRTKLFNLPLTQQVVSSVLDEDESSEEGSSEEGESSDEE